MEKILQMYYPITGTPFQNDETYREVMPCAALLPYIRCFWGTEKPLSGRDNTGEKGIVIPDTCMDVIFDIDYTKNTIHDSFCAIDEQSYVTMGGKTEAETACFAIRFYAWSAILFSDEWMMGWRNRRLSAAEFSEEIKKQLMPYLFDVASLDGKIKIAEMVLLHRLNLRKMNSDVMNVIYRMIKSSGRERIEAIAKENALSVRQMERLFDKHMGISPKSFSSLIRYQMVWQDICRSGRFQPMDAVEKYGYSDQAHLLHDFKKRHLMTPGEALLFARERR